MNNQRLTKEGYEERQQQIRDLISQGRYEEAQYIQNLISRARQSNTTSVQPNNFNSQPRYY